MLLLRQLETYFLQVQFRFPTDLRFVYDSLATSVITLLPRISMRCRGSFTSVTRATRTCEGGHIPRAAREYKSTKYRRSRCNGRMDGPNMGAGIRHQCQEAVK